MVRISLFTIVLLRVGSFVAPARQECGGGWFLVGYNGAELTSSLNISLIPGEGFNLPPVWNRVN